MRTACPLHNAVSLAIDMIEKAFARHSSRITSGEIGELIVPCQLCKARTRAFAVYKREDARFIIVERICAGLLLRRHAMSREQKRCEQKGRRENYTPIHWVLRF